MKLLHRCFVLLVLFFIASVPVIFAQGGTVAIEGVVHDASGAAVVNATVEARNPATGSIQKCTTSSDGSYRLMGIEPAQHLVVSASATGFAVQRVEVESLRAGERRIVDLAIATATVGEKVEVTSEIPIARTTTPELGGTLSEQQVNELPANGRDLISLAYLVPGAAPARGYYNLAPRLTINGASSLTTTYAIDGFDNTDMLLGGPKVPVTIGSTQDLAVLVDSYTPEYGRTGNGVFSVTTKGGGNQLHGEEFYTVRPGSSIDANNYFAPKGANGKAISDSFQRNQFGGAVGGPVVRGRTFYFANIEMSRESQDAILTSPLSVGLAPTSFHNAEALGKIDQHWSNSQSTSVRYVFSDYTHDKDVGFIGGLVLPSAGLNVKYLDNFGAITHTSTFGSKAINEFGIQFGQEYSNWNSVDDGPRVVVMNGDATEATIGGGGYHYRWTEDDVQFRDVYSRIVGRNHLRFGMDFLTAFMDVNSVSAPLGSYTVDLAGAAVTPAGAYLALSDLPTTVTIKSYVQTFNEAPVEHRQNLPAGFAEDTVRLRSDLTATLAVRWDYDSLTNVHDQINQFSAAYPQVLALMGCSNRSCGKSDLNNFAPRVGFNWAPFGSQRQQIRGGYGIFYERIPYAIYSDTASNRPDGGAITVAFDTAQGSAFPAPTFPNYYPSDRYAGTVPSQLPPRNVQVFDPNLKSPWNQQFSIGYVCQITKDLAVSADYVNNRGHNLIRRIDINAPTSVPAGTERTSSAADATRPIVPTAGGFRLIEEDQSSGHSRFNGFYLHAKKRFNNRFSFDAAYTISKTMNDTDDINFRPRDSRDPNAEWGPSMNDRRHVLALSGVVQAPLKLEVLPILFLSSGQPFNVTTGNDDNGDTIYNDRPAGYLRNSERTSGYKQVDLALLRKFKTEHFTLELKGEAFNVFNFTNFSGFFNFGASGVRLVENGALAFQPTQAGPARQFQFNAKLQF